MFKKKTLLSNKICNFLKKNTDFVQLVKIFQYLIVFDAQMRLFLRAYVLNA